MSPSGGANPIYFPNVDEITPLAVAFAQMMFAHSAFEREVRELEDVITGVYGFGEKRQNQWSAPTRPGRMAKLISKHRGAIPEAEPIKTILTEAIRTCFDRDLLAHGEWWRFDPDTSTIDVRGGTQWTRGLVPHKPWTRADIMAVTEKFKNLQAALYKFRHAIKERTPLRSGAR
jgi:hypothetical protein